MPSSAYHEALWEAVPEGLEPSHLKRRLAYLLGNTQAGDRVLDVGCGEGHFAAELLKRGRQVVGLDVAEEPLRRARTRWPELDLRLIPGEAPWPLEDSSFDAVWAGEVIEHVADTTQWMSEVRRVLRSGGGLLLSTPAHDFRARLGLALSPRTFASHFDPRSDHLRFYSARTLRDLLSDFGFHEIELSTSGGPLRSRTLLAKARRLRY